MSFKKKVFVCSENGISLIIGLIKVRFLKFLQKKQLGLLFLPAGDGMSHEPLIFSRYELAVTSLIDKLASEDKNNKYLIDIGANIGLSVKYLKKDYSEIHCFEPNPLAFKVLEANLMTSKHNIFFHNVALGIVDGELKISVPNHNIGGAYIESGNMLSKNKLINKDGLKNRSKKSHSEFNVEVKSSKSFLKPIFQNAKNDKSNIIIKIDVEGFEENIIRSIPDILPVSTNLDIVFENLSNSINLDELLKLFKSRKVSLSKLTSKAKFNLLNKKVFRLINILLFGRKYRLEKIKNNKIGTLLLSVR